MQVITQKKEEEEFLLSVKNSQHTFVVFSHQSDKKHGCYNNK